MLTRPAPNRHVELSMLMGISACLLGIRLYAASRVGFGDSEALYAAYALHPQPAYLDHPGLVGVVARAIGGGTAPDEQRAHVVTSIVSTLLPWGMALTCRSCGASWRRSFAAALVFALVPEVAIGLFALTPDLLLALAWTGALAAAADALRSKPGSARSAADFVAAGLLAGVAAASKATGVMLMAALVITYASRAARPHARTVAPWLGLAAGCLVLSPVVLFETHSGWPMLRHRLVDSQAGAGMSMHNAAAVFGGQLAYLSPLVVVLAWRAGRDLWRSRGDVLGTLLLACCFVPLAVLLPLCLWSRVAEPHWLAPVLLALVPAAARVPANKRAREARSSLRLVASSCALSGAIVAAVYAWVLVPSLSRLVPPSDARLDIANELHGWPDALHALRDEIHQFDRLPLDERPGVAVVGPHWVICAQVDAALRGDVPVGCNTPIRDDFD
ncbi:MAG: glycosyltransferase family 39 protein, partial [Myxococcota bacterium]|nr:glycosyltransferase family 39 protein [Myxococcota bacterium]